MLLLTLIAPLVFLWTGTLPLVNVTPEAVLYYLLPMILAVAGGIWALRRGAIFHSQLKWTALSRASRFCRRC
jgi:hypothetical protein